MALVGVLRVLQSIAAFQSSNPIPLKPRNESRYRIAAGERSSRLRSQVFGSRVSVALQNSGWQNGQESTEMRIHLI
jgi:hypothetical protein